MNPVIGDCVLVTYMSTTVDMAMDIPCMGTLMNEQIQWQVPINKLNRELVEQYRIMTAAFLGMIQHIITVK